MEAPPPQEPQGQDAAHVVEDVGPALHGDALEHRQDGKQDIVKVGDAEVGSRPVLPALCVALAQPGGGLLATGEVAHWLCICEEQNEAQAELRNAKLCTSCRDHWALETSSRGAGIRHHQKPPELPPPAPALSSRLKSASAYPKT